MDQLVAEILSESNMLKGLILEKSPLEDFGIGATNIQSELEQANDDAGLWGRDPEQNDQVNPVDNLEALLSSRSEPRLLRHNAQSSYFIFL